MRVNPQESLENTSAFFHITLEATALSLIAKRRKTDDSGMSFQDKTVNTQRQPMLADNPSHR